MFQFGQNLRLRAEIAFYEEDDEEAVRRVSDSYAEELTCTYLAEHLKEGSHDVLNDFLRQKRFMPRDVWKLVKERIEESKEGYLMVDKGVHDKRYARGLSSWCGGNTAAKNIG